MGCDIHTYAEKRISGRWESISKMDPEEAKEDYPHLNYSGRITDGRDYRLFGLLSGVRVEDWGFRIIPDVQMCIPADASPEVHDQYLREDCDAHTPGHVYWQDLLDARDAINVKLLIGQIEPRAKDAITELLENFQHVADENTLNVREMRIVLWYDN